MAANFCGLQCSFGSCAPQGLREMRHIRVGQLWVQETAEDGELKYKKVNGDLNPADMNTKCLTRLRMDALGDLVSLRDRTGRADESLEGKLPTYYNADHATE